MKERDNKVHDTHISEKADQKKMDTMKTKKNIATKDDKKRPDGPGHHGS